MTCPRPAHRQRGFLLLEVVLALAVFGMAATGFAVALNRMGKAADLAQRELRLTRILDTALDEHISLPVLEEGVKNQTVPDSGIELDIKTELLTELKNEDGQALQEMYRVEVTAHWFENGQPRERSVETWRYGRLYQP